MDQIILYAIWAAIIVTGLAIVTVILFSIRNLLQGRISMIAIIISAVIVAIFVILALTMTSVTHAAITTAIVALVLGMVALLFSGVRSVFSM